MDMRKNTDMRIDNETKTGVGAGIKTAASTWRRLAPLSCVMVALVFVVLALGACGRGNAGGSSNTGSLGDGSSDVDGYQSQAGDEGWYPAFVFIEAEMPYITDNGDSYSILFPGEMFEDVDLSDEFIEVNEYEDAFFNEDGSVTIIMSQARHQWFLDRYREDVDFNIDYFIQELDFLHRIAYTPDFRSMDIYVDGGTDEGEYYWMVDFFSSPLYYFQQLQGREIWMEIAVLDVETNEVLLRMEFPE